MRTKLFCTVVAFTLISVTLNAQQWNVFGGNYLAGAEYIGANGTSIFPLELKTIPPLSINFYTNNLPRATILGNGKVGIGINNPLWQLDVADEINISQPRNYFMIGGETVLHNAGTENIFTGVNCGKDILAGNASANMNTFNGFSAGEFASGNDNVFIGHSTGRYSNGQSNSFMGTLNGSSNAVGSNNTFIGTQAGSREEQVNNAVAIGYKAEVECNDCTVLGGKFVGINTTTPKTTLEVNGTITTKQLIIANENQKQDLIAILNELKNEIGQLKEQINQLTKN
ncbi:MAG: hypothetical protein V9G42_04305 [Bacteroidia bacterium]